jgi:hypothetical protein
VATHTNRASFLVAAVVAATVLVGCPLLKKKKQPEADDDDPNAAAAAVADAATTTVSGTGAKNEKAVLRYAQEEPLNGEVGVIGKDGTKARNFPGNGPEVATLNKGTAVVKIAKYFSTGVLVEFTDPAGEGNLLGWVPPHAFATDPTVVATTKPVVVPPAATLNTARDAGGGTSPTPVATKDAGTTPTTPVATVDAGGGGGSAAADDPWSPANLKYKIATPPRDGKCPPGFANIVASCRRLCVNDAGCAAVRGTFCVRKSWSPQKYCSTDK